MSKPRVKRQRGEPSSRCRALAARGTGGTQSFDSIWEEMNHRNRAELCEADAEPQDQIVPAVSSHKRYNKATFDEATVALVRAIEGGTCAAWGSHSTTAPDRAVTRDLTRAITTRGADEPLKPPDEPLEPPDEPQDQNAATDASGTKAYTGVIN